MKGHYPPGTRVRKINSETGDGNPDGALGTLIVTAFIEAPVDHPIHGKISIYVVDWEKYPGLPVHVLGPKLEPVMDS